MFPEAYRVVIKSSRFSKLLQTFEESADWVLLIGVVSGDMVSLHASDISFHFVL